MTLSSENHIGLDSLPDFVKQFADTLKSGDVVCLSGPIGAGKTTFMFYLMKVLNKGVDVMVSSPTFTIHNSYELEGRVVHHLDLYRLESFEELEQLDLLPLIGQEGSLTFVEWGEKFPELDDQYTTHLEFVYDESRTDRRTIRIS